MYGNAGTFVTAAIIFSKLKLSFLAGDWAQNLTVSDQLECERCRGRIKFERCSHGRHTCE